MSVKTAEQRPRADVGAAIVERAVSAISGSRSFRRWRSSPYGLRAFYYRTREQLLFCASVTPLTHRCCFLP